MPYHETANDWEIKYGNTFIGVKDAKGKINPGLVISCYDCDNHVVKFKLKVFKNETNPFVSSYIHRDTTSNSLDLNIPSGGYICFPQDALYVGIHVPRSSPQKYRRGLTPQHLIIRPVLDKTDPNVTPFLFGESILNKINRNKLDVDDVTMSKILFWRQNPDSRYYGYPDFNKVLNQLRSDPAKIGGAFSPDWAIRKFKYDIKNIYSLYKRGSVVGTVAKRKIFLLKDFEFFKEELSEYGLTVVTKKGN